MIDKKNNLLNIMRSKKNVVTYISGGKLGDFIFQLSVINEIYLITKKKEYYILIMNPSHNGYIVD